jgi:hypothetical protein
VRIGCISDCRVTRLSVSPSLDVRRTSSVIRRAQVLFLAATGSIEELRAPSSSSSGGAGGLGSNYRPFVALEITWERIAPATRLRGIGDALGFVVIGVADAFEFHSLRHNSLTREMLTAELTGVYAFSTSFPFNADLSISFVTHPLSCIRKVCQRSNHGNHGALLPGSRYAQC